MGKKGIGVTLVELVVAMVVGTIIISVTAASIISVLKFFYSTSGRMALTQRDWVVANATLTECVRDSSYYTISSDVNGSILNLFPYTNLPGTPTATWVFKNTPAGLTLERTGRQKQLFENVAAAFTNPNSSSLPNQQLKVDFTKPFTAAFYYTCGRVNLPYEWAVTVLNTPPSGFWNTPRFRSPVKIGPHIVKFGFNTVGGNTNGVIVVSNRYTGATERIFSYNWVRGQVGPMQGSADLGFFYWNQPMISDTDYAAYSYIGGMASNATAQMPVLAQVDIRVDTDDALTASTGAINTSSSSVSMARSIDITGIIAGTDDKKRCYISDVKETSPGSSPTTLICAGQVYLQDPIVNPDNIPTSYSVLLKDVDLTNLDWTPDPTNTSVFGPDSDSSTSRYTGLGNRADDPPKTAWPWVPKLSRLDSLTSGDYFLLYNTNTSKDGTNLLGVSNIEVYRPSTDERKLIGNDHVNWARLSREKPYIKGGYDKYRVWVPYITNLPSGKRKTGVYKFTFGTFSVDSNYSYDLLTKYPIVDGVCAVPEDDGPSDGYISPKAAIVADDGGRLRIFYGVGTNGIVLADGVMTQSSRDTNGTPAISSLLSLNGYDIEPLDIANGLGSAYHIYSSQWDTGSTTAAGYSTNPPLSAYGDSNSVDLTAGPPAINFGTVCRDTPTGQVAAYTTDATNVNDPYENVVTVNEDWYMV